MNVESLKSELQQVLDNDVVLRKEFNDLKRSLSDYRNQLIMRDEDCKRLQVTIDVLNTKLVVMERDNNNYKAELTSFKELRSTIKEQLQAKQEEIEARLVEIQGLKDDLNTIAAGYEQRMEEAREHANLELEIVKQGLNNKINALKEEASNRETSIKADYELKLSELSSNWTLSEQNLIASHEDQLNVINAAHQQQLQNIKNEYEHKINGLSSGSQDEINALIAANQSTISALQADYEQKLAALEQSTSSEINNLRFALDDQKNLLTFNFNSVIESLTNDFKNKESQLVQAYEKQISELNAVISSSQEELNLSFQNQVEALKVSHENILNQTISANETRVAGIISEYEEKLSNTLIHSNTQNSKLQEELSKAQVLSDSSIEQIRELSLNLENKNIEIGELSSKLSTLENQLTAETEKYLALSTEFEGFKQSSSLSVSEQVNELNNQIANINLAHSDYVNELTGKMDGLSTELSNLGIVLESTTNSLGQTEATLEAKIQELENARLEIQDLHNTISISESNLETFKAELLNSSQQEIKNKEVEFQKLLAENTNLINEIDLAQDKVESLEAEISLLKSELEEVKLHSAGKAEDFKEVLANKNFEITNLEANNAALNQELLQVKQELANAQNQLMLAGQSSEQLAELQQTIDNLTIEKANLLAEISSLQFNIGELNNSVMGLNSTIDGLNNKIENYENEIAQLNNSNKTAEQEAFIDKLFKQIDGLNDERLVLLEEKEQMANQLLKMNDVIGSISHQVESEEIDVTNLNNHRKNVILATNSGGANEKSQMKEQINDLVREIDKCIALLSA